MRPLPSLPRPSVRTTHLRARRVAHRALSRPLAGGFASLAAVAGVLAFAAQPAEAAPAPVAAAVATTMPSVLTDSL